MTTVSDYDARRVTEADTTDQSELQRLASMPKLATAVVDADPHDSPFLELPGAALSGDEWAGGVIPQRSDEFTCSCCFLVQHRNRLRFSNGGSQICADCV